MLIGYEKKMYSYQTGNDANVALFDAKCQMHAKIQNLKYKLLPMVTIGKNPVFGMYYTLMYIDLHITHYYTCYMLQMLF
jgi:hypothetical protein